MLITSICYRFEEKKIGKVFLSDELKYMCNPAIFLGQWGVNLDFVYFSSKKVRKNVIISPSIC